MNARYNIFISCTSIALLFLFGRTAVEVISPALPVGKPPLSLVASIGIVAASVIAAVSLVQMVIHFINTRFFPIHHVEDELCLKELGPINSSEKLPSEKTIREHANSGDNYWASEAKRIQSAEAAKSESNRDSRQLIGAH